MLRRSFFRVTAALPLLMAAALVAPIAISAQQALYVQNGNMWRLVVDMQRETPFTMVDGRLEAVDETVERDSYANGPRSTGTGFAFRVAEYYAPVFLKVENVAIRLSVPSTDRVNRMSKTVSFRATIEPPEPMSHVYAALEITAKSGARRIVVQEVGDLKPQRSRALHFERTFDPEFEAVTCQLHLFLRDRELLQSLLPADELSRGLDRLVELHAQGINWAEPAPLMTPAPTYPAELRKTKLKGSAVVEFELQPDGRVGSPRVKEASHPAFGAAAVAAVAEWRYGPAVKSGAPAAVPMTVTLPFAP